MANYKEITIYDKDDEALFNVKVSNDIYDMIRGYKLHNSHGYIRMGIDGKQVYLHKFIMYADKSQIVDHINGDRTDCRTENLRFVTKTQNNWNSKVSKRSSTGVKGVSINKDNNKYRARIHHHGKRVEIGSFATLEEAKIARAETAIRLQGEYSFELRRA